MQHPSMAVGRLQGCAQSAAVAVEIHLQVLRPDDEQSVYTHLATGERAVEALRAWIDKYDLQCMRCTQ